MGAQIRTGPLQYAFWIPVFGYLPAASRASEWGATKFWAEIVQRLWIRSKPSSPKPSPKKGKPALCQCDGRLLSWAEAPWISFPGLSARTIWFGDSGKPLKDSASGQFKSKRWYEMAVSILVEGVCQDSHLSPGHWMFLHIASRCPRLPCGPAGSKSLTIYDHDVWSTLFECL